MTIASPMTEEPPAALSPMSASTGAGLRELFEKHHQQMFRTAYRVLGNANDAEDVLQTVFLRLLNRPPAALVADRAGGYLYRAAINASLDLIRSRKRSRLVALDQNLLEEVEPAKDGASDPDRRFASRELRGRLRQELAKVNPRAAEMFVLRYFEGYRNSEIGPMLGTSRMTVAVTLHRLRKRLRAALAEEPQAAASESNQEDGQAATGRTR